MAALKDIRLFGASSCYALLHRQRAAMPLRAIMFFGVTMIATIHHGDFAHGQAAGDLPPLNGLNPALLSNRGTLGGVADQNAGTLFGQNATNNAQAQTGAQAGNNQNTPGQNGNNQAADNPLAGRVGAGAVAGATAGSVRALPEIFEVTEQQRSPREPTIQGGGGRTADTAPFEPLGVRVGKYILRPALEVDTGYTTNSTNDVTGSSSAFVSIRPELNIESDLARHALGLQVDAGLDRFASGDDSSDLEVTINATGRFDVDEDTSITGTLNFVAAEDDLTGVSDDPLETTTTASLQLDHALRQIDTRSQVRVSRNSNGSFVDAAGVTDDQEDLNSVLFGANLRGTLRSGGAFEPFVEADVSREIFDEDVDDLGNGRNVTELRGIVGVEIDRGEKLTGDIGLGFAQALVDGDGIEDFGAFVAEFNLNWSPQRLTTVTFNGATTLDAFPSIATPGDTTYTFNLNASRDIRDNLTATAGSGLLFQVDGASRDTDTTFTAGLGLEYQLGRNFGVALNYNYAQQFTADGGADFTSNTFTLGLRAER
ncbi:MAG: outer membrane beta-barrel protein [Hyphomicrobiales bacterium]